MKIAFNISPLNSGHKIRGIGSYTKNLLNELKKNPNLEIQEFVLLEEVKKADLVHFPFFDLFSHTLPISKSFPVILTIHDVTPLIFPIHYPKGIKGFLNLSLQKIALKSVKGIITDSNSSKRDIEKYLSVTPQNIYPVYLAPGPDFKLINDSKRLNKIKNKYNLPDKFALFMGNVNWNKNLINMAEACKRSGVTLVLTGSGFDQTENLNHPELILFKEFQEKYRGDEGIKVLGFLPIDDLVLVTNLANSVLLPSFYEGFGLPILDAQICGTPVVTSSNSSMIEIAGDGAIFVNPNDVDDISKGINLACFGNNKDLIERGFINVNKFSWEKCAGETIEVYKKVLENL